ncbi:NYN domain-containing protein [bacterium]|nr:NYN domain-containing protein [bacterium]
MFYQKNNTTENQKIIYVFIDASNIWNIVKSKRKFIEYSQLKNYLKEKFNAKEIKIFYYDAYPKEGTRDYDLNGKHRFYTYLKKGLGFVVRKKELKRISIIAKDGESIIEKGNMDVEMTIDVLHYLGKYNIAVFFTGDSDFLALVSYLRNRGKKVYIFSSQNSVSEELRTGGDGYFDVKNINKIWGKDLRHREDR